MDLCYRVSDNKYDYLPAKMSDGRHFTDYRSKNLINELLIKNNKVHSSHSYKNFLMNNANELRILNSNYCCQKNCINSKKDEIVIPFKNEIKCDTQTCRKTNLNPNGIGLKINNGNGIEWINKEDNYNVNENNPINKCNTDKYNIDFFLNKM
jgi:hypothetical protein